MASPAGFRLLPDFVPADERDELERQVSELEYEPVVLHGQAARRVVRHFGLSYAYGSGKVEPTEPMPPWLDRLRRSCAEAAGVDADAFVQALVTRYPEGATSGWDRDAPAFGAPVVGVSLTGTSRFRFRRRRPEPEGGFDRHDVDLAPGSAYVLDGAARWTWQHAIAPVPALRHSVTFRTLRE